MTILEPAKELPVSGQYDTLVVGGGFAVWFRRRSR